MLTFKLRGFTNDRDIGLLNPHLSPLVDILNECARLGLLHLIVEMVSGVRAIMSKPQWTRLVWQQAWTLEDAYWRSANLILKENDLLVNTLSSPGYLSWWHLSDTVYGLMRMCENMAKLVCHASKLKCDDCSLKGKPTSSRTCTNCDSYLPETLHHILMQCPSNQLEVSTMIEEITRECDGIGKVFVEEPG